MHRFNSKAVTVRCPAPATLGAVVAFCVALIIVFQAHATVTTAYASVSKTAAQCRAVLDDWWWIWTFPNRFRVHDGGVVFDWSARLESTFIYNQIGLPDNCLCVEAGAANGITGSICQLFGQMGCMVHFVEPEPTNIEHIRLTNQLEYRLFEGVLCDKPGALTFRSDPAAYKRSGSLADSHSNNDDQLAGAQTLHVKCFTLQDVIPRGYNVILSLDLEGYEEKVVPTIQTLTNKPVALMYEYSRMEKFLDVPGYRQMQVIDNNAILLNDAGLELRARRKRAANQGPAQGDDV
jgi:FkbM family methyltransferase